jgi:hypothetical protein
MHLLSAVTSAGSTNVIAPWLISWVVRRAQCVSFRINWKLICSTHSKSGSVIRKASNSEKQVIPQNPNNEVKTIFDRALFQNVLFLVENCTLAKTQESFFGE